MFTLDDMRVLHTQPTKTANHFLGDITEQEFSSVRNRTKYSYVNNNPYKYTDPNGQTAAAIGAEAGFWGGMITCGPYCAIAGAIIGGAAAGYASYKGAEWIKNNVLNESAPDVPEDIVGDQDDPRAGTNDSGTRHTSGPLTEENGGTGNAEEDFDTVGGGTSEPAEDMETPGSRVAPNGIRFRPGTETKGPRIEIPANGDKPHETLHYPDPPKSEKK